MALSQTVRPGDRVRDRISKLEGIATSRTEWLYGCVRVGVQPEETKDGKPVDATCIDEAQLEVLVAGAIVGYVPPVAAPPAARRHGPREDATRATDPRRI